MAVISSNPNSSWDDAGGNSQDGALFSPKPGSIEVYPSGDFVDLLDPDPETIHLEDIAHHLSMCCRYAGGVAKFYSVSEHTALVHDLIPHVVDPSRYPIQCAELQRAALLHDAAEAYTGDNTAPLKFAMREGAARSEFDVIATRLDTMIALRFNVSANLFHAPELKLCDLWAMRLEAERLTKTGGSNWRWPGTLPNEGRKPLNVEFVAGMQPQFAKARWKRRAFEFWPSQVYR